jgi:hypothetical protein
MKTTHFNINPSVRYSLMGLYGGIAVFGILIFQKPLFQLCDVPYSFQTVAIGFLTTLVIALLFQIGLATLILSCGRKKQAARIYNRIWTIIPISLILNGWMTMFLYLGVVQSGWGYAMGAVVPISLLAICLKR